MFGVLVEPVDHHVAHTIYLVDFFEVVHQHFQGEKLAFGHRDERVVLFLAAHGSLAALRLV